MNLNSLHDVYVHELKDLYSAEKQITEALPKMVKAASDQSLKDAFSHHLDQTQGHLQRVRQILDELDENPGNVKCDGMEGLIKEGEDVIKTSGDSTAKDAALIAAAQRVEHYEIAAYGAARSHAKILGYDEAANTLQRTLDEEGETDKKLTQLAEGGLLGEGINESAR
ncbi:MAG: ferritin-like domain-containing protein [Anaerolineaceae bacterium]|nr:ferritin-like domain-containing protein [Anaerolineaceae bacterium]